VAEVADVLGLTDLLERRPGALSGGQRQRVAMGRAIVREPAAFLTDEPLSNLDAKLRVSMRAQLTKLHERLGVTTVYVTHDQVEAMTLGTRVAVLRDGVLQQCDAPQALLHRPANLFVAAFIGSPAMNLVEADVAGDEVTFGGHRVALPPRSPLRGLGRRVILGVRPTDFEAAGPGTDPALPRLTVKVDVVEKLGPESHLIFAVDAPRISAEAVRAAQDSEEGDDACSSPTTRARSSPRASTAASKCAPATRSRSRSTPLRCTPSTRSRAWRWANARGRAPS
jgi:multiple sugar transport system ATP-binding protein